MENLENQLQQAKQEIKQLKLENQKLKALLIQHNINVDASVSINKSKISKSNAEKLKERLEIFKSLFKGRTDVYAVRWESKTGKSGYIPACKFEWQKPICQKPEIKCSECSRRVLLPLTDQVIYEHLTGKKTIGLYPLLHDETCWFLAVDFDKKSWQQDVQAFMTTCREQNVPAHVERSRSGNGAHVWIFFNQAIQASLARRLGNVLLAKTLEKRHEIGMDSFDRLLPSQNTMPKGGFGNLIALPLQNEPRKKGNSVFVDENFMPHPDQWSYLKHVKKMSIEDIRTVIKDLRQSNVFENIVQETNQLRTKEYADQKLPKKLKIIEKNGLYIEKTNLPSSLVHQMIQLATFNNPEFFKRQAKRLSTHNTPRMINCSEETDAYIVLPRGCKEQLVNLLTDLSIEFEFETRTNSGSEIAVSFIGELRSEQETAVTKLLAYSTGILSATTGFGKTVVAASIIANRKINTLIIVHRKQLIDQWKMQLSSFLNLANDQIGQMGGGKTKLSGIVDIATIQSLNYKGKVKDVIQQYGQIIVDECHHISAFSFEKVLKEANATYIHGLTATPARKDGLERIMTMQLGSIRYKVSAKKQAMTRPFEQILIPRYTNFKSSCKISGENFQGLYQELMKNEQRNDMIFDDVLKELDKGAVPLILTERVEHVYDLQEKFTGFAKNIITLTGGMSNTEEATKMRLLEDIPDDAERLLIATGKYIGEGFDYAPIDTLFLVMPISWKGTLQQYVGRLHRFHNKKEKIKVYDYVDENETLLKAMFEKRLKTYHLMGYQIFGKEPIVQRKVEQLKLF
ncbi:TOTE conflict system archaeo-eukaryotic primase domain-containing protein [Caldifermentibacillus hisashii]|uniref:TOTE conflict system archaeo-eukaryotic primase domain-containing protein n=1 Tax=Caldifermentibacillus hisashii TaxID=996558 RepID=UPI003366EA5C